jgi:hypothetical protein
MRRAVLSAPVLAAFVGAGALGVSGEQPLSAFGTVAWRAALVAGPASAVAVVARAAAEVLLAWVALGVVVSLAGALPGAGGRACAALARRITPRLVRHLVEAALGVGLTAGAVAPATAAPAGDRPPVPRPAAGRLVAIPAEPPAVLPAPGEPVGATATAAAVPAPTLAPRPPARPAAGAVIVRPGDSLWALARRRLGPTAPDAAVAAAWPRWYAANLAVIGADPDLIRPGQHLSPPR